MSFFRWWSRWKLIISEATATPLVNNTIIATIT